MEAKTSLIRRCGVLSRPSVDTQRCLERCYRINIVITSSSTLSDDVAAHTARHGSTARPQVMQFNDILSAHRALGQRPRPFTRLSVKDQVAMCVLVVLWSPTHFLYFFGERAHNVMCLFCNNVWVLYAGTIDATVFSLRISAVNNPQGLQMGELTDRAVSRSVVAVPWPRSPLRPAVAAASVSGQRSTLARLAPAMPRRLPAVLLVEVTMGATSTSLVIVGVFLNIEWP